ncbi:MAG: hypothetical protein HC886_13320 [Leptolyngbyaceae cyanobacterium SM1_1_3]|nr:hypothetical protein [Leptolyngbyaceae cyanobacterium SM1_1_3]
MVTAIVPDLIRLSEQISRTGTAAWWLPAGERGLLLPDTRRSDHAPSGMRATVPFWSPIRPICATPTIISPAIASQPSISIVSPRSAGAYFKAFNRSKLSRVVVKYLYSSPSLEIYQVYS